MSAVQVFWKHFSFSHSVFYLFGELSAIFINFEVVVCNLFWVWKSLKLFVWERVKRFKSLGLSHPVKLILIIMFSANAWSCIMSKIWSSDNKKKASSTHYHTILHFDILKMYNYGKHCEKRRNCLYQAISPFLTMFSTLMALFSQCFPP